MRGLYVDIEYIGCPVCGCECNGSGSGLNNLDSVATVAIVAMICVAMIVITCIVIWYLRTKQNQQNIDATSMAVTVNTVGKIKTNQSQYAKDNDNNSDSVLFAFDKQVQIPNEDLTALHVPTATATSTAHTEKEDLSNHDLEGSKESDRETVHQNHKGGTAYV